MHRQKVLQVFQLYVIHVHIIIRIGQENTYEILLQNYIKTKHNKMYMALLSTSHFYNQ